MSNGKIFIAGATQSPGYNPGGATDAVLVAYDTSGNFLTYKTWGDTLDNEFRDIAIFGNNIYLSGTSGYHLFSGGSADTGFVMKINMNTVLNSVKENSNLSSSLQIYPNPASDRITIRSSAELGVVIIYNSLGEIVSQVKTKNSQEQIDISKFPAGIYTLLAQGKYVKLVKE